jgi:hypothetical protein
MEWRSYSSLTPTRQADRSCLESMLLGGAWIPLFDLGEYLGDVSHADHNNAENRVNQHRGNWTRGCARTGFADRSTSVDSSLVSCCMVVLSSGVARGGVFHLQQKARSVRDGGCIDFSRLRSTVSCVGESDLGSLLT